MTTVNRRDLLASGLAPDEIEVCDACGNACAGRERIEGFNVCDDCRGDWEIENPTWEQVKADIEDARYD